MKSLTQLAMGATVVLASSALVPTAMPTPSAAAASDGWEPCEVSDDSSAIAQMAGEALCREATVPADYDRPDGETTSFTVAKIPAGKPADRIGSLVVNYGVAGTGLHEDAAHMWSMMPHAVTDRFDLVAVDARMIDASAYCFDNASKQQEEYFDIDGRPETRGQRLQHISASKNYAKACDDHAAPAVQQTSSATLAKDLDEVRKMLGEETLNIYASEGHGLVGQWYANLFPQRARAIVVDGVDDGMRMAGAKLPRRTTGLQHAGRVAASEAVLDQLLTWCEQGGPDNCQLAEDHPEHPSPQDKVDKILAESAKGAIFVEHILIFLDWDGNEYYREVRRDSSTHDDIIDMVTSAVNPREGQGQYLDGALYALWKSLVSDGPIESRVPWMPNTSQHQKKISQIKSRQARFDAYEDSHTPWYMDVEESALLTTCNDVARPSNIFRAGTVADRAGRTSPLFGKELGWQTVACSELALKNPKTPQHGFKTETTYPVLFLAAKHSPEHHYEYAKQAVARYPKAELITDGGWENVSYGNNECTTAPVTAYLIDPNTAKSAECPLVFKPFEHPLEVNNTSAGNAKDGLWSEKGVDAMLAGMPERRFTKGGQPYKFDSRKQK